MMKTITKMTLITIEITTTIKIVMKILRMMMMKIMNNIGDKTVINIFNMNLQYTFTHIEN